MMFPFYTKKPGATVRDRKITGKVLVALALAAMVAVGLFTCAVAENTTTLTVDCKGVTPNGQDSWLSLSLTGRFDVSANGEALGQVTANPTAEQVAQGASDMLTLPAGLQGEITLTPVAEDFAAGYVCTDPVSFTVQPGQANRKTMFAYATRGFYRVENVSATDGALLGGGEYVVLDASGAMQASFTVDTTGMYTATQALPNGDYQLVQLRAPDGMLLLSDPVAFRVATYFGNADSIAKVRVENTAAPTENGRTGAPVVSGGEFSDTNGSETASVLVSGLCAGENTLPLQGYTLTLQPAEMLDGTGSALAGTQAVWMEEVTVTRPEADGSVSVQGLDAQGKPMGQPTLCATGVPVALTDAAGVAITYLNANGETTVPAGFTAGSVQVSLRYQQPTSAAGERQARTAKLTARVQYTYAYEGPDGISTVTADSDVADATVTLALPDGRTALVPVAAVETLADSSLAIALTAGQATMPTDTLPMAVELPEGARIAEAALPDGLTLVRTAQKDYVVFDTAVWASGTVSLPVAAGEVDALTVWVWDPCNLPVAADAPEGFALRADAHEPQPLLDAFTGHSAGQYAQYMVTLAQPLVTGKTADTLAELASGTVGEAAGAGDATVGGLGVLLQGETPNVQYGAVTDEVGTFAVFGNGNVASGTVSVMLPANTQSAQTGEIGVQTMANLTLPQTGLSATFVRMSALAGTVATQSGMPLANVTVQLMQNGETVQTVSTDVNGRYAFAQLQTGAYDLRLTLPANLSAKLIAENGVGAQTDGSYAVTGIALADGESRTVDIPAALLGTVQGTVTKGSTAVQGLAVTLTDAAGSTQSTRTDDNGAYSFAALAAGDYSLCVQLAAHQAVIAVNDEPTQSVDQYQATLTLQEGERREDRLTLEDTASVTGQVAELGAGQTVTAASADGQYAATTDDNGNFAFDALIAGDYTLYAPLPEGKTIKEGSEWQVSQKGDMIWLSLTAEAGNAYALPAVDYVAMTGIEGVAYLDNNGDHTQDASETLMSGVTVALQQKSGDTWTDVSTATTDEYGHYAFTGLKPGVYRVVSKADTNASVSAVGNEPLALGDAADAMMTSAELTLDNGQTLTGESNIALALPVKVHVTAFYDSNENGVCGEYERAIAGVTVEAVSAKDPTADAVASSVTNANGEATLEGLNPGDYVLRTTLPDGTLYTVKTDRWAAGYSCVGNSAELTATSDAFTLTAGSTMETAVGAIPVGSFSGTVWSDENNNGVMDEGEPGVAGVELQLKGVRTGNTYTFTTDDTGTYRFTLLRDDAYDFTAKIPDGMLFARYTQTGGDSRSVFTTEGTTATRQFVVSDAQNVTNKNVGIIRKATVSGLAFLDTNYNGVYDEGEPAYSGVTLELVKNSNDRSIGKTVTGEDGRYTFDSLRGGDYRLRAILPNDGSIFTVVSTDGQGLVNLFAAREGRRENTIPSVTVLNGKTTETCVGVAMGGTITGTVFLDAKYDGVRNDSDKKASGVKVQLIDAAGTLVTTATTNANGNYTLEGIMPGTYQVRFQRRDNYAFTRYRPDEKNGNHVKTLAKDGYGETETLDVAMGQSIERIDAGMLPSSTVTGIFFDDLNDNGLRDEGEPGFTDGKVRLLSQDQEIDLTEPVSEDGTYLFDGVMPGEYTITYLLPENAIMAKVTKDGNTLDAQGQENVLQGFKVESGKAYTAPLTGAVTLGTFEGVAFHDQNGNGLMDDHETALPGVQVQISASAASVEPQQTTTDDQGRFSITGLRPAQYSLTVLLPEGYIFSGDIAASSLTLNAVQQQTLSCPWQALTNRAQNLIGAVKPATIRASVWLDENRDGQHTEEERLMAGLQYELVDETLGRTVKTAVSGEDGVVTFENVRPSTYTVRFTVPAQAQPVQGGEGTFTVTGSQMNHSGIVIAEGETFEDVSGGLVSYTSIGGAVSLDENGTQTPQAGITVTLYEATGTDPLDTTQTDENGAYQFDGLWPGQYRVVVTKPDGMIFVRPDDTNYPTGTSAVTDTQAGASDAIDLHMAQDQLKLDVVLMKPARVGDQVWLDENANGLLDADEPGIAGVTVQLMQNGEAVYTTTSNAWGYYEFTDVYPGEYTLQAQAYSAFGITKAVPALRMLTSCLTGGDGTNATSDAFRVQSGTRNFDFDLGYVLLDGETMPEAALLGQTQGQNWSAVNPTPAP